MQGTVTSVCRPLLVLFIAFNIAHGSYILQIVAGVDVEFPKVAHYQATCGERGVFIMEGSVKMSPQDQEFFEHIVKIQSRGRTICSADLNSCDANSKVTPPAMFQSDEVDCFCMGKEFDTSCNRTEFFLSLRIGTRHVRSGERLMTAMAVADYTINDRITHPISRMPTKKENIHVTVQVDNQVKFPMYDRGSTRIAVCPHHLVTYTVCTDSENEEYFVKMKLDDQTTSTGKNCLHFRESLDFESSSRYTSEINIRRKDPYCVWSMSFNITIVANHKKVCQNKAEYCPSAISKMRAQLAASRARAPPKIPAPPMAKIPAPPMAKIPAPPMAKIPAPPMAKIPVPAHSQGQKIAIPAPPKQAIPHPSMVQMPKPPILSKGHANNSTAAKKEDAWVVIQRREFGNTNFYRNWHDYVTGFGDPQKDFWLGLKKIHMLCNTQEPCELMIDLKFLGAGEMAYAAYNHFCLGGAHDKFRLSVNGFNGDVEDALSSASGASFSTYDQDNDVDELNLASLYRGGWWYLDYFVYSNLNGIFEKPGEFEGMRWLNFPYNHAVVFSEMKVRQSKHKH